MSVDFTESVVSICRPSGRGILGVGFVISESGLIVTCYHVLDSAITKDDKVLVRFKPDLPMI